MRQQAGITQYLNKLLVFQSMYWLQMISKAKPLQLQESLVMFNYNYFRLGFSSNCFDGKTNILMGQQQTHWFIW